MKLSARTRISSKTTNRISSSSLENRSEKRKSIFTWLSTHKLITTLLVIVMILAGTLGFILYKLNQSGIVVNASDIGKTIKDTFENKENTLDKLDQTDNRTNVLIIGIDARNKEDSLNTDSLILLSYDHNKNQVAQISFPRDLKISFTVDNKKFAGKINSVFPISYSYNESFEKSTEDLGKAIETISGLPIHYGVIVNFQAFKQIINSIGGVDINVENTFCDAGYPTANYRTEVIRFKRGLQHMDGDIALKFARSRVHDTCYNESSGEPEFEGNDFMRARRQQKVIEAVKQKIVDGNLLTKANFVNEMISSLGENIYLYKVGIDEINNGVNAKDQLTKLDFYSMVIDTQFGATESRYLIGKIWDDNGLYEIRPTNSNSYKEVKTAIQNYLENSFLLIEKPELFILTTAKNSYQKQVSLQKIIDMTDIPYEINFNLINIKTSPTPTDSLSTTSPTPTTTANNLKIYVIDEKAVETLNFLKSKLAAANYSIEVEKQENIPEEMQKYKVGKTFLIVLK